MVPQATPTPKAGGGGGGRSSAGEVDYPPAGPAPNATRKQADSWKSTSWIIQSLADRIYNQPKMLH